MKPGETMRRLGLPLVLPLAVVACSVSIRTVPPGQVQEVSCLLPDHGAYLTADSRTGLGVRLGTDIQPVIWPVGFSARRELFGPLVLVDPTGNDAAREGDLVGIAGEWDDGVFHACDVTVWETGIRQPLYERYGFGPVTGMRRLMLAVAPRGHLDVD